MSGDDITKVSIVMSNFDKASAVVGGIAKVAAAVPGIVKMFSGEKSDTDKIIDALTALGNRLEGKLSEIKKVLEDKEQIDLWMANRDKFHERWLTILDRARQLSTLSEDELSVEVYSKPVDIATWCEGKDGVLDELGTILSKMNDWLVVGEPGNPGAIAQWQTLVETGAAARVLRLKDETHFGQMFLWYQSVCMLVQTATYVRNAALKLYRESPNPKPYYNLDTTLRDLGSARDRTGAWKAFGDVFAGYLSTTGRNDEQVVARESFQSPRHRQRVLNDRDRDDYMLIDPEWGMHVANGYLAGIKLDHTEFRPGGGSRQCRLWYLAATVVSLGDGGTTSFARERTSSRMVDLTRSPPASEARGTFSRDLREHYRFGCGYVEEPDASGLPANASLVVNGCRLALKDGYWVMELRYGVLEFGEDGRATVRDFDSVWRGPKEILYIFEYSRDVWIIDMGEAESASLLPITNATLARVNEHLGVRARCGWTGYKADLMQPAWLRRFSPPRIHVPRVNLAGVWEFLYTGYLGTRIGAAFTLSIEQTGGHLQGRSAGIGGSWMSTNHKWQGMVEGAGFTLAMDIDPPGAGRISISETEWATFYPIQKGTLRGSLVNGQITATLTSHMKVDNRSRPDTIELIGRRRPS